MGTVCVAQQHNCTPQTQASACGTVQWLVNRFILDYEAKAATLKDLNSSTYVIEDGFYLFAFHVNMSDKDDTYVVAHGWNQAFVGLTLPEIFDAHWFTGAGFFMAEQSIAAHRAGGQWVNYHWTLTGEENTTMWVLKHAWIRPLTDDILIGSGFVLYDCHFCPVSFSHNPPAPTPPPISGAPTTAPEASNSASGMAVFAMIIMSVLIVCPLCYLVLASNKKD